MDPRLESQLHAVKNASRVLGRLSGDTRAHLLTDIADSINSSKTVILAANERDVLATKVSGMSSALIDRLTLTDVTLSGMIADIRSIAALPDPLGDRTQMGVQPSSLHVERVTVPLGVVGVVYESRPNVTSDIAALCIRSGNGVVLRGGSETIHTNRSLVAAIRQGLGSYGESLQFIDDNSRERVREMIRADKFIDVIIPRGGSALGRLCSEQGTIPVIIGGAGVCHLYIDRHVDKNRAIPVVLNAKLQKTSVCNALDTLLIHQDALETVGLSVCSSLADRGVSLHASGSMAASLKEAAIQCTPSKPGDLTTEWLSMDLNVVLVPNIDAAIAHIAAHGTHSDGILSEDKCAIAQFIDEVDSPAVLVNASTRFHDGGQFGLGAEVAVSTQKVHARGPLGLQALTSQKWIATGDYLARK